MLESDRKHIEADREGVRWGVPLLMLGAFLLIGGMIFSMSNARTPPTAVSDNTGIVRNTGPAPTGAPIPESPLTEPNR